MSQHDFNIANQGFASFRTDLNNAIVALASNSSGDTAPTTPYANQWWYDSANDILKVRSEANDAWISVAKLDQTLDQFFPIVGGVEVTATGTELNFVDGVTSAIQTQLNAKAPLASPALTGTPTAPTAAVGTNTTQVATTAFVSANLGVTENENRIINGAFDFWQRGTSFTASAYGADRWQNLASGGTVTQSRQGFTVGDTLGSNNPMYFLRQTVSGQTTSAQVAVTGQAIEGVRSYAGQTITILGWARRSSGTGNMVVEGNQNFGTGGSPSAAISAISPTTVTLTGSFAPFAAVITVPSITGKTLGTNANDYFSFNIWTSAGSDYNARTNSLGLQTIGVDLWGIHIKVGTHTTAATDLYKQPEYGTELARCQRYCSVVTASAQSASTGFTLSPWFAPVTMRTTPVLTVTSAGTIANTTILADTVTNATMGSLQIQVTTAGGYAINRTFLLDAEL